MLNTRNTKYWKMTKINYQFYRKTVRYILILAAIILPFIKIRGEHLLIFDITTFKFHIFGLTLNINQFLPILFLILFTAFLFMFITVNYGRIWCGWICPQSVSMEVTNFMKNFVRNKPLIKIFKLIVLALVSVLISVNILLFFFPYEYFFPNFLTKGVLLSTLVIAFLLFLNFLLIRFRFCATVCPYSMLQSVLFDRNTLAVWMIPETRDECIKCLKCVRACSTGIDIRQGQNSACINCAKCIDACSDVMKKFGKKSLFAYRFGEENIKRFWKFSTALSILLSLIFLGLFLYASLNTVSLQMEIIPNNKFLPRTNKQYVINSYILAVENNRSSKEKIVLKIDSLKDYEISPSETFFIPGKSKQNIIFYIKIPGKYITGKSIMNFDITSGNETVTKKFHIGFRAPVSNKGLQL